MTSRITFFIFVIFVLQAYGAKKSSFVKNDTAHAWLDTIPPVVQIQPKEMYHNTLFHVTITSSEQGTIWFFVVSPGGYGNRESKMGVYREPITIMQEGTTRIYFQAEDIVGNKSNLDSILYVFDSKPPSIEVTPDPGRYRTAITVKITTDKPCEYYFVKSLADTLKKTITNPFVVKDSLSGYVIAIDRAHNSIMSKRMWWIVDSSTIVVNVNLPDGVYNKRKDLQFIAVPTADIYYTFDPSALQKTFVKFEKPVPMPYGNTILRYYAKGALGIESDVKKSTYLLDTLVPKIVFTHKTGIEKDTLVLSSRKMSTIRYTLDGTFPIDASTVYTRPICVEKKGRCTLKSVATDIAGNRSELFEWNYKYDKTAPKIAISRQSGLYNSSFTVTIKTSKPCDIFYTLDGSEATSRSTLYKEGISISKEGITTLRVVAIDNIENASEELKLEYVIDTKPPYVKVRVEEDVHKNLFLVSFIPDEDAIVYYEIDGRTPTENSEKYSGQIALKMGQSIKYFAIDKSGNKSDVKVMDDLKKPIVSVSPDGGVYNKPVKVTFFSNEKTAIYWAMAPDTIFTLFKDSLVLNKEGNFTFEYYSESQTGLKSPIRRCEYFIDLTPPRTDVIVKKGNGDSVSVFFECSKNATIYFTLDGTNPAYSKTTRTAGNKFLLATDRISVPRKADVKLAYYSEDAAGNQSPIRVLDVFKPRTVPDIPFGIERVYDRVLSVTFNTYDSKSMVYYARHGHVPTTDSSLYTAPITLASSDTLLAFVMDAAGYRGQIDTFIYKIDLPPTPSLVFSSTDVLQGAKVLFDASKSVDTETPKDKLLYRWNFTNDTVFDIPWNSSSKESYTFVSPGLFTIILEVKDAMNRISKLSKQILVRQLCPAGMVSMSSPEGKTFCIDKYEWPNIADVKPQTSVSWVQAKVSCMDAGKRLCTQEEWIVACRGIKNTEYPYGVKYEKGKCPTEGSEVNRSGKFLLCGDQNGPTDMVGNVWEWVENKRGDYPIMMGGSIRFGQAADCRLTSEGGVGLKSSEVGFRCCK